MSENGKIKPVLKTHAPKEEIGTTGLRTAGLVGIGRSGVTTIQEEFLKELEGDRKYRVYREMVDNEPLISGTYFAIRQLIKRVEWTVEPASDSAADIEAAEFIEGCLDDMSEAWSCFLDEALSFIPMGFSVHEIVYKQRLGPRQPDPSMRSKFTDGRIGWRKLPIRAQETVRDWILGEDAGVIGVVQRPTVGVFTTGKTVRIPIQKLLLFRNSPYKGNPEGRSVFRASYVPFYYKKRLQTIEAIGIERELNGFPVMHIPAELFTATTAAETAIFEDYKKVIRNLRTDDQAGLLMPSSRDENGNLEYELNLMSTQGRRSIDVEAVINRYNKELLITVMADFLLLGHEEGIGSYALSNDKTRLFSTAIASFMGEIVNVFNKHAIPRLIEFNNFPNISDFPRLKHGDIETESMKEMGEAMEKLALAGFNVTDDAVQQWVWERIGFPQPSEPDKLSRIVERELDDKEKNTEIAGRLTQAASEKDNVEN